MELNVYNRTKEAGLAGYKKIFAVIGEKASQVLGMKEDDCVSVIFVKDKKMHEINLEYRDVDRTTDVISFALRDSEEEGDYFDNELGDIFINIDAARRQAEEYQHSLRREICFLYTHGLCHLNGYDHMKPEDEKVMIEKQKEILDDIIPQDEREEDL